MSGVWAAAHAGLGCPTARLLDRPFVLREPLHTHTFSVRDARRSDLAAIFVQLFEDDALAFACFERLMRSARRNFKYDETGIK